MEILRNLKPEAPIIMITPVVPVIDTSNGPGTPDPYQPFGRALEERHKRIRHVPYLDENLLTSTHHGLIKLSEFIIIFVNDVPTETSKAHQFNAAVQLNALLNNSKPLVVVITNRSLELWEKLNDFKFATVVQVPDYTPESLELAASVMFGEI